MSRLFCFHRFFVVGARGASLRSVYSPARIIHMSPLWG